MDSQVSSSIWMPRAEDVIGRNVMPKKDSRYHKLGDPEMLAKLASIWHGDSPYNNEPSLSSLVNPYHGRRDCEDVSYSSPSTEHWFCDPFTVQRCKPHRAQKSTSSSSSDDVFLTAPTHVSSDSLLSLSASSLSDESFARSVPSTGVLKMLGAFSPGVHDSVWTHSKMPPGLGPSQFHESQTKTGPFSPDTPNDTWREALLLTSDKNMPFSNLVERTPIPKFGVLKIENIPYGITKQEIVQFLGPHARLITPELGCAVHIIMERSTAKTMDCYVEFMTVKDAEETVTRLNSISESGRPPRLGRRHVDVTLSSQDELLKDLFPRAKCIEWRNGVPHVVANTDPYSSGFSGFLTSEELYGVVQHAEHPHRSPFAAKCPQRTFESVISTIWKFPWYATDMYTVEDRDKLFNALNRQILALTARMKERTVPGLDQGLVMELLRAGCNCPAFNERQKFALICNSEEPPLWPIVLPNLVHFWPFDTLAKSVHISEQHLLFYASLIRRGLKVLGTEKLGLTNSWRHVPQIADSPYGKVWIEWSFFKKQISFETAMQLEQELAAQVILAAVGHHTASARKNAFDRIPIATGIAMPCPTENRLYAKQAARRAEMNDVTPSRPSRQTLTRNRDSHIHGMRRSSDSRNEDESLSGSLQSRPVSSIWSKSMPTPIQNNEAASLQRNDSRDNIKPELGIEFGDLPYNMAYQLPQDYHSRRNSLIMPSSSNSANEGSQTRFPVWQSPGHGPAASMDDIRQSQSSDGCCRWLFETPQGKNEKSQQAVPKSF